MLKNKLRNLPKSLAGQKRVIRFGMVGGINTLIDFGVFLLLHYVFGIWVMVAHVTGFCVATLNSYLLNKYWTFDDKSSHSPKQILTFLGISLAALVISSAIVYIGKDYMPAFMAKILAIGVAMVWNYLGNRFFVFHHRETRL